MRKVIKRADLRPSDFSSSQKAKLEIISLMSAPDLQTTHVFGGTMSPEIRAENERKSQERRRRKNEIIAKYGVFDEYLGPLREQEQDLSADLTTVRQEIADLEKLQKK